MSASYIIHSVLIMCLATYIPRAIPITFFNKEIKSRFIKDFLFYVPYAVLSALTIPSIFYITENIVISIIGTLTAIILSLFRQKLVVVAIISVIVVLILSFII